MYYVNLEETSLFPSHSQQYCGALALCNEYVLHGFSGAYQHEYAVSLYLVFGQKTICHSCMQAAKTKVAPLTSLPMSHHELLETLLITLVPL